MSELNDDVEAPRCRDCEDYHYGPCQSGVLMTNGDFRDPPQEMLPYCRKCGALRSDDHPWEMQESEVECDNCGKVGQWDWRLRYEPRKPG